MPSRVKCRVFQRLGYRRRGAALQSRSIANLISRALHNSCSHNHTTPIPTQNLHKHRGYLHTTKSVWCAQPPESQQNAKITKTIKNYNLKPEGNLNSRNDETYKGTYKNKLFVCKPDINCVLFTCSLFSNIVCARYEIGLLENTIKLSQPNYIRATCDRVDPSSYKSNKLYTSIHS